jgi:hypothetical protein
MNCDNKGRLNKRAYKLINGSLLNNDALMFSRVFFLAISHISRELLPIFSELPLRPSWCEVTEEVR